MSPLGESVVNNFGPFDVARSTAGNYITPFYKLGYGISTGTSPFTVCEMAKQYIWPISAQQMEVVSTDNTNDKAGGTGVQTVCIAYLDSALVEKTTTVIMNGTTAVPTECIGYL